MKDGKQSELANVAIEVISSTEPSPTGSPQVVDRVFEQNDDMTFDTLLSSAVNQNIESPDTIGRVNEDSAVSSDPTSTNSPDVALISTYDEILNDITQVRYQTYQGFDSCDLLYIMFVCFIWK